MRSDRIEKLRSQMVVIPAICMERSKYYTQSYQETEALPVILRRAHAVANVLDHMKIFIADGELIVGSHTGKTRAGMWVPEINGSWLLDELDTVQDRVWEKYQALTEEEKELAKTIFPYWEGKTASDLWKNLVPDEFLAVENVIQSGGNVENGHYPAHFCVDYVPLLSLGLEGTIRDLKERKAQLKNYLPDDLEKIHFYDAAIILQEAVIRFGKRYAELAREMALTEENPQRKDELLEIARICEHVPAKPAETLREAIQSAWFLTIALTIECPGAGVSMGRTDQYLYPFYEKEKAAGTITRDEAKELFSMLLIKMNDIIMLQAGFLQVAFSGYPVMQGLTIGGVDANGENAVNELSYIILDAEEEIGLTAEEVVIRVADNDPKDFLVRAVEVARNLGGKLKFVSDDSTIAALEYFGLPKELARDYISCGCHCPMVPAESQITAGNVFNLPLILELTLNKGIWRKTGQKIGADTKDPRSFENIDEIMDAFQVQFEKMYESVMAFKNADLYCNDKLMPCPLTSSLYHQSLERGMDIFRGGIRPYGGHVTGMCGLPNIADSLSAIQKAVFEKGITSMENLLDALDHNFEGQEELLARLRSVPHFGNDQDEVDSYARDILRRCCEYVITMTAWDERPCAVGCIGMTANIPFGEILGAFPDGRLAGEPLSEGGISPYPGRNVSGITAVLNSVSKIDHDLLENGSILNIRIAQNACKEPEQVEKLASLIRVYSRNKGSLVQFNFTGTEVLLDAQKHPEHYRDLMVRVATYSSYFVELSTALQDNIISRTAMGL